LIIFDIDKKFIFVNLFNNKISEFSINIVDLYILLEIGSTMYPRSEDMKDFIINQLGDKSPEVKRFISTLKDFSYIYSKG